MFFAFKNSRQLGVAGKRMTSVGLTWELGAEQGGVLHRAKDPLGMTGDAGAGGKGSTNLPCG